MSAPLWLLDVDGVLNAVQRPVADGYSTTRTDGFAIAYRPEVIDRIKTLHGSGVVDVRWLTTWVQRAVDVLSPDLGLPVFAVEGADDIYTVPSSLWWKSVTAQRLSDREPDRALIWTDDDLDYAEAKNEVDWLAKRTGPTLAISPNPMTGLSDEFLDRIEAFARRHGAVAA